MTLKKMETDENIFNLWCNLLLLNEKKVMSCHVGTTQLNFIMSRTS